MPEIVPDTMAKHIMRRRYPTIFDKLHMIDAFYGIMAQKEIAMYDFLTLADVAIINNTLENFDDADNIKIDLSYDNTQILFFNIDKPEFSLLTMPDAVIDRKTGKFV